MMKSAIVIVAVVSCALFAQALDPLMDLPVFGKELKVTKRNVAAGEVAEVSLTRVARATQFSAYVESNIDACVMPSLAHQTFCNANYMVPTVFYRRFSSLLNLIHTSFSVIQRNLSASCSNSLKNSVCKGSLPRCSSDRKTVTFPDFSSGCAASLSCGTGIPTLRLDVGFRTMWCGLSGKQYSLTSCKSPTVTSFNSNICGKLPGNIKFPDWMVPFIPLQQNNLNLFKQRLTAINVTNSCMNEWMKVSCNSVPFCTTDSTKIVGAASTQSCQTAMNCLVPAIRTQFQASGVCVGYPDSNGQKVTVSSDNGYSYAEVINHGWKPTSNILVILGLSLLSWLLYH